MQLLYDFFPVLLFFVAYKLKGIFFATGILIIASAAQIVITYIKKRRIELFHLLTFLLILIFGGLTIWLHDANFLKWKVSIINWVFAGAFLLSNLTKKNLIQRLLEGSIKLPEKAWKQLNMAWASLFFAIGTANYLVMTHCSTDVWVDFKVFVIPVLSILFVIGQTFFLYRYLKDQKRD